MLRNGFPLFAALLLSACSAPSFMGDDISSDASFLGLESYDAQSPNLASATDYPDLQNDIADILQSHALPPPVTIRAEHATENAVAAVPPALPTQPAASFEHDASPNGRAYAYLQALFRGDGEGAWRYATVPAHPKYSWWDSNTAKGALLMKAGSSEYFASQKQGVSRIEIPASAVQLQGGDATLVAQITYGNGSRSNMTLRMINERGQWWVAEE